MSLAARTPVLLTVVITLTTLELSRVAGAATGGSTGAAVVTALGFAGAALAGPLVWWLGVRRALPAAVGGLALARLLLQLPALRTRLVIAAAVALALAALVLAIRRTDPARAAVAIALAVGADVALRLPLDLWDPVWRGGALGWLPALAYAALLGALARDAHRRTPAVAGGGVELALLGPALALYGAYLASPGLVASQGGVSLTAAGLWIATGTLAGVWGLLATPLPPRLRVPERLPDWASPAPPALLAAAVLTLLLLPGFAPLTALATIAGLATLPAVLRTVLGAGWSTGRGALADLAAAGAGAGLGYLVLVLPGPGQLRVVPEWWPVLGALGLGVAAWFATGAPDRTSVAGPRLPRPFVPVLLATGLLAFPPLADATRTGPEPLPTDTAGATYRLLSWNVHYAVDGDGEVVPDDILDVVRRSGAHVVLLQEVPRGWQSAGGLDLAAWLERRLDAEAVWAPAADRQFGNLILTSLPVLDSTAERLPLAGGGMDRSYASVTVRLTDGETASITTTHLEGDADAAETRRTQLDAVLSAVGDAEHPDHAVLAGDFNAEPDSAEIDTVLQSGFTSAQDEAGDPGRLTHLDPRRRVDWIFGARAVAFEDFHILDTGDLPAAGASDHLPLTTTVWLD